MSPGASELRGSAQLLPDGASPVRLGPGDVVFLAHGYGHGLADDPSTPMAGHRSTAGKRTLVHRTEVFPPQQESEILRPPHTTLGPGQAPPAPPGLRRTHCFPTYPPG
ncbi:cupin domain-containing protein [Streptomyces sp. V4I23]|uniref:cupin domain-containing protein n=1 Tax=Streptomyces sp. V4I23 TaxID=3042282 RepID=UPI00358ED84F